MLCVDWRQPQETHVWEDAWRRTFCSVRIIGTCVTSQKVNKEAGKYTLIAHHWNLHCCVSLLVRKYVCVKAAPMFIFKTHGGPNFNFSPDWKWLTRAGFDGSGGWQRHFPGTVRLTFGLAPLVCFFRRVRGQTSAGLLRTVTALDVSLVPAITFKRGINLIRDPRQEELLLSTKLSSESVEYIHEAILDLLQNEAENIEARLAVSKPLTRE